MQRETGPRSVGSVTHAPKVGARHPYRLHSNASRRVACTWTYCMSVGTRKVHASASLTCVLLAPVTARAQSASTARSQVAQEVQHNSAGLFHFSLRAGARSPRRPALGATLLHPQRVRGWTSGGPATPRDLVPHGSQSNVDDGLAVQVCRRRALDRSCSQRDLTSASGQWKIGRAHV